MPNFKQNKLFTRSMVALGTLAAGLGIWAAVANQPSGTQTATAQSTTVTSPVPADPNFSSNDTFLAAPNNQNTQSAGTYSVPSQPMPRIRTRGS